jgi:hypothetical protein
MRSEWTSSARNWSTLVAREPPPRTCLTCGGAAALDRYSRWRGLAAPVAVGDVGDLAVDPLS